MNDTDEYDDDEVDDDEVDGNRADDYDDDYDDDANDRGATTATEVLEYLARAVVVDPDSVEIDIDDRGRTVQLNVHVAPDDMGRVIGRRGRIANAIRTVVRAAAANDDIKVEVEFVD